MLFRSTGARRSRILPELPTIAEQGFPGYDVSSWYAMLLPAKTPPVIAHRLRDELIKAINAPDVQQTMGRQGLDPETGTPQEAAARIKSETAVWAGVVRDAGIKAE